MNRSTTDNQSSQSKLFEVIGRAMVRIFTPVVRILLRHGISYQSAADWLRWCYVNVADKEFTIEGKRQTKSRVAIITGITRLEVARQLAIDSPFELQNLEKYQRASRVLSGWKHESQFQHADGSPRKLTYDGESPNFSDLVDQFSGGTTPRAMLDELIAVESVRELADGSLELVAQKYIPKNEDKQSVQFDMLAHAASGLISTVAHNTQENCQETRLQLQAYNRNIPVSLAAEVRQHIKQESIKFIYEMDDYLYEKSPENEVRDEDVVEIGIGAYLFQNE